ncbi:MAG TPA: hypothetical protein VH062_29655 [Polyangiaceae bacterium]|nr:hypothetical protein [Polyangiaceae bacterium]
MRALVLILAAFSALATSLGGCTSDSGNAGGGDTTMEGKKLAELTQPERAAFCATNRAAFADLVTGSCSLSGEGAPTTADCETAVAQCRATDVAVGTVCADASDAGVPDFSDCGALLVSQVESCLAEAKAYFAVLGCDSAGQEPPTLPGCLGTLEQSCPVLLTGTSD